MFSRMSSIKTSEAGYISGPKYCETQHPTVKGGFEIQGDKYWLRFNSSFLLWFLNTLNYQNYNLMPGKTVKEYARSIKNAQCLIIVSQAKKIT